jgi:protein-tyrosine phosphatase
MKIVFVCTGNASRSAATEVVLKKMIADNGIEGVEVSSCGTKVPEGLYREDVMCRIAAEHGYDMGGKAVPMSEKILNTADVVVVMTQHHRDQVTRILTYDHWERIILFNDFCFGESTDLPDPHYQTEHVYRTCFNRIESGCKKIIEKLKAIT